MHARFKPTKAHIIYGELLKRKDLIQSDVYSMNPISRETIVQLDDKTVVMYRIDEWVEYPLVFFSDLEFKMIEDRKFIKMAEKYVNIK